MEFGVINLNAVSVFGRKSTFTEALPSYEMQFFVEIKGKIACYLIVVLMCLLQLL